MSLTKIGKKNETWEGKDVLQGNTDRWKKCFERNFRKFYRKKVLHVGGTIMCVSISRGLTVWIAALWKRAGGPGTQAERGSAIKANHVL